MKNFRCYIEECDDDLQVPLAYNQSWLKYAIPGDGSTFKKCQRYAPVDNDHSCGPRSFNTSDVQKCDRLVTDGSDLTTIEHEVILFLFPFLGFANFDGIPV